MKYRQFSLIAFFAAFLMACTSKQTVDHRDYAILTTAKEIDDYYENIRLDTSGRSEKTTVERYFDGAYQLEYEYELLETEQYDPFYYNIKVEVEPSEDDAVDNFKLTKSVATAVNSAVGLEVVPFDSLNLPGDESYYYIRTKNGEPNGIILGIRSGSRLFSMISSGIYSDDQSMLTDFVLPKLEGLAEFSLEKD